MFLLGICPEDIVTLRCICTEMYARIYLEVVLIIRKVWGKNPTCLFEGLAK